MKSEHEFFDTAEQAWESSDVPGVSEKVLSRGDDAILTRLARWDAGLDTSASGIIRHGYVEEVYLIEGDLTDLTLGQTFGPGYYASRPIGMPHGPYRTDGGCTMLEIRYR